MRWAGNVTCMGEKTSAYRVLVKIILKERNYYQHLDADWRIILEWIL
jgi:hypothetical protein